MAHKRNQALRSERDAYRRKKPNGSKSWEERTLASLSESVMEEATSKRKRRRKRDTSGKLTKYDF